jgi:hypothetical protein
MLCYRFRPGFVTLCAALMLLVARPQDVSAQETNTETTDTETSTSTNESQLVADGSFISIHSYKNPGNPIRYVNADDLPGYRVTADTGHNWYSAWLLVKATQTDETVDSYYLYNEPEDLYIGKTSTTVASDSITLVKDIALAGRYKIYQPESGADWWGFEDVDNSTVFNHIQIEPTKYTLINFRIKRTDGSWADNSKCAIEDVKPYFSTWYDELYNSKIGERIGDIPESDVQATLAGIENLDTSTWQAYKALESILESTEHMIEPKHNHYYRINSAFPYFQDNYLAETYYAVDYHGRQSRQRIHFNKLSVHDNIVPTFWEFDCVKTEADKEEFFRLRAANSQLVMRQIVGNTVLDTREDTDSEAGIFSIRNNEDLLVYNHAITIHCSSNNNNYYMATFTTNQGTDKEVTDVRGGNVRKEATNDFVQEANNWYMQEVRELEVYFEAKNGTCDPNTEYIKTICLPFAVQLPDGVNAYTASFKYEANSPTDSKVQMELISTTNKIIPAKSPVVLKAYGGTAKLTVLYPDENSGIASMAPYSSGLKGTLAPMALAEGEVGYVINEAGTGVKRVIEGIDYSYDHADTDKTNSDAVGYYDYSLYGIARSDGRPITYILPANEAFVDVEKIEDIPSDKIEEVIPDTPVIEEVVPTTSGITNIKVEPVRDTNGNLIYYDLTGRATVNPAPGLYLLSTGCKVLLR